jgi:hypothetical protein
LHRIWVAALILAWATCLSPFAGATGLSFKAGTGYDFLSQQYFLDSAARAGVDSLLTGWALKTNYLDDFKGVIEARYESHRDRLLEIRSVYEQTPDLLRLRTSGDYRPKIGRLRLDWRNELDIRQRYRDTAQPGDSYVFGATRTKLYVPVSQSLSAWTQVSTDGVHFSSGGFSSFNNYRVGGKVGVEQFSGLSMSNLDIFFLTRQVPDSNLISYMSGGAEASIFGFHDWGQLDLSARFERKNYSRPDKTDDYSRLEFEGRGKVAVHGKLFSRQEFDFEGTWFDPNDLINFDYDRYRAALLMGYEMGPMTVAIGPAGELLTQQSDSQSLVEDYFERGGKLGLDYMKPGLIFGSFEFSLGYRGLKYQSKQQTNFWYERISLIGDVTLLRVISFNILLSGEWEWHSTSSDNNRLLLLSSGLTYGF